MVEDKSGGGGAPLFDLVVGRGFQIFGVGEWFLEESMSFML